MKKHYRTENDCLNCGTILQGHFCHVCGQENLQIKESFGHMMNHAISDYFHFDHQFFHTLKPLFLKPGLLTNEYMAGRRTQYLHPVKMYIFISLVYFLVVFQQKHETVKIQHKNQTTEQVKDSLSKIAVSRIDSNKVMSPAQKAAAVNQIKIREKPGFNIRFGSINQSAENNDVDDTDTLNKKDTSYAQYLAKQQLLPPAQRDGWFDRYMKKKTYVFRQGKTEKLKLINETIQHNFPKIMFLLLPLFALILRVAFWSSKKFYVEHLIYAFHLHCFIFLFMTIILIISLVLPVSWDGANQWLMFCAALVVIWYVYRSLRVVYQRSRWRTISKMIGITLTYLVAFSICITLFVLIVTVSVV